MVCHWIDSNYIKVFIFEEMQLVCASEDTKRGREGGFGTEARSGSERMMDCNYYGNYETRDGESKIWALAGRLPT